MIDCLIEFSVGVAPLLMPDDKSVVIRVLLRRFAQDFAYALAQKRHVCGPAFVAEAGGGRMIHSMQRWVGVVQSHLARPTGYNATVEAVPVIRSPY